MIPEIPYKDRQTDRQTHTHTHNIKNNKPKGSQLSIPIKEALWLFKVTQDNNLPNEGIMVDDLDSSFPLLQLLYAAVLHSFRDYTVPIFYLILYCIHRQGTVSVTFCRNEQ